MPNQHYFVIDMTKMGLSNKDEVSDRENPGEKAIHIQVIRSDESEYLY